MYTLKMQDNQWQTSDFHFQSLDGFIIIVTEEYNIFYISDNVQDYLGFPQVNK